jgi:RsiW-degrading membrane proteinase PrsW (M82 family)
MRQRAVVRSGWLNILGQALFVVLLFAVGSAAPIPLTGVARTVLLALLVLLPSVLWAGFFYLQDRRAPEPSRDVLLAFVAGMAAASLVALPAEDQVFRLREWMYGSLASLATGATLVRGGLVSLLFYGILRWGFAPSAEFDEPIDGPVYGAFVGSGFGAIHSLAHLVAHPEFTVFVIGYTASVNVLFDAGLGALIGHFVGRAKFVPETGGRARVLALGLGPGLVGAYHTANELVFLTGWQQAFWLSLAVTLGFAGAVLVFVTATMRRLAAVAVAAAPDVRGRDGWVLVAFVAMILVGATVGHVATRPVAFASARYGVAFAYPPTWLTPTLAPAGARAELSLMAPVFTGRGPDGVRVSVQARRERVALSSIDPIAYLPSISPVALTSGAHAVGGRDVVRATYAYLKRPEPGTEALPEVVWGYADIVPGGTYTYTFTFEAPPARFRRDEAVYRGLLGSVTWTGREG